MVSLPSSGCNVFTPSDGGSYKNTDLGVSVGAGEGAVRDIICITAEEGEETTNGSVKNQWLIHLEPESYNINARDLQGSLLMNYELGRPSTVCIPLTYRNGSTAMDSRIVAFEEDGSFVRLPSRVRVNGTGLDICGELGVWSSRVAAAHVGTVNGITPLTPTIVPPDAGGSPPPTSNGATLLLLILGIALAVAGLSLIKPAARRE